MGTCKKCKQKIETKRVITTLNISETNKMPVSSRVETCTVCGHQAYSEKEKSRLRELIKFYQAEEKIVEMEIQEMQDKEETSA